MWRRLFTQSCRQFSTASFQLARLQQLVTELGKTTSRKSKIDVLRVYPDLQSVLDKIYSPGGFGVKSSVFDVEGGEEASDVPQTLEELLNLLSSKELADKAGKAVIRSFAKQHQEYTGLIRKIVDKNLEVRIGRTTIQSAFLDLPRDLPVALAVQPDTISEMKAAIADGLRNGASYLYSRKLDGVRCLVRIEPDRQITFLSRRGRQFPALKSWFPPHFDSYSRLTMELGGETVYLDGELVVVDAFRDDFREDFRECLAYLLRDPSSAPSHPRLAYFCFDCLTESEVLGRSPTSLAQRLERLRGLEVSSEEQRVFVLPQWPLESSDHLDTILSQQIEPLAWEGVIVRRSDAPFRGRRHSDILKLKTFREAEYRVLGTTTAPMRFLVDGAETECDVVAALVIEHKGETVHVGSGLSAEERRRFRAHPEQIVGKDVTVRYFEETMNEHGRASLRFPTVKAIHEGERIV